jgi:DMSO/TMAO reductase YedYZ molybdopterin-dependent catalytic subunit
MEKVRIVSPDTLRKNRVPPGQVVTEKFPILSITAPPRWDPRTWRFRVTGLVAHPYELTWQEFTALPTVELLADFHCVTGWSKLGVFWEGVPARLLIERARPLPQAKAVMLSCLDGYTTNLMLDALLSEDVIFAYRLDGEPLPPDHGGPLRLIVPQRYAWKSAKFVTAMELLPEDKLGFWERRGYHREGDPWKEQRYWGD